MTKVGSGAHSLYHIDEGKHREALLWHDNDHKAEVIGTMEDIYLSQRWVSPPEWIDLRPENDLPHRGGEYVNLYWARSTPEKLSADFGELGDRLGGQGRMPGLEFMHRVWPTAPGFHFGPTAVLAAKSTVISPEAVVASTGNTGLIMIAGELTGDVDQVRQRHEAEYLPALLEDCGLAGVARLESNAVDGVTAYALLAYTDDPDPAQRYADYLDWSPRQTKAADGVVFSGVFCPSIGHYEYYD